MKTTFLHRKIQFGTFYMLCVSFILLRGNNLLAQASSATISFNQFQTKAACSPVNAEIGIQLFIIHPTSSTETYEVELKYNSSVISVSSGTVTPLTSMPANQSGNPSTGKWVYFSNLQAGVYDIKATITTGSLTGNTASSTITITNHLPPSDYFKLANNPGQLNLDLITDFCAVGNGTTNDALSCYNASLFINDRYGAVNLTIPSGTYLINIQDPNINFPANRILFDFIECTNLTIAGATGSGGSPASIFKFAGGQRYGCFDANPNQNPNPNPIVCSLSTYTANPGTLFNFYKCVNIVLSNIEGDGNNSKMIFGGSNFGGAPNVLGGTVNDIQVAATGLRIDGYNKNFTVTDCNFNNFCLDGITINGGLTDPITGAIYSNFLTKDQNPNGGLDYNLFQNIDCNNNSRIGISISAGKYIKLLECDIYNTGQGVGVSNNPLANAPATGIDIEPNEYVPTNAPLDGCSQIVIEKCSVKYSYAHALTILSKIHPSDPNADFVSQWITSKESYYADYDDNALLIEGDLQTQATIESNGLNVTFEDDKIVGSFWRGCYPNAALDQPKFIRVTFLEDDFSGPNGTQYQNYNKLFYSHNHCQQMFFDECTFTVNHAKSPIYLFTRDAANVDTSKYALFKDCTFNYENNHVENYNNTLNGIVFVGCKFQGKTTFNNNTSEVKNIKAAGVILNGSIDPCTPSLFKLDKNMIFTYNNSHSYDDYNAGTGQTILVTASVNKPFNIGPPTTINSIPTLTYANFEIPDGSTFRSSVYENYYNPGGVLSTSPPEIYIGEKSRFLMYGTTGTTQFLAHHPNPNGPSLILKNEGQFILAPNVNVAVHNLSIQNPNTTNITYFDPGVVKPTWWTNNNNDITASGSNCYYTPLITSQLNFPVTNPPSTAFDQVKWNEKFTVYYKLTFGNNCLGSINYLIRGGSGNYTVLIDGQNNTQNLSFGAHTFSVQDVNNPTCVFTFGFDLKFDGIGLNPNCVNSNGYIFANKGGVPNLTYSISPNIGTQNPAGTFSNLPAGTYIITASGSGCSITTTITLYQPNSNHCCTTTSNPNAGSNIASMPYIILLPNTQVANLTAANLLSSYGSNGVIQGKKFYIDGILTIDADITLDACELWFTSTSSIALDATHDLNMINNTILQASCDWWGGITASNSANKITMTNSTLKNAKFGLHVLNDALIEINGSTFADCGQHAIYMSQMNLNPYPGFILNTTISSQNNLPSTIWSKTFHGIELHDVKQLQIGVPNNSSPGNTFNNLYNGIYITNTNTTLSSTIELYNNSFSNIEDNTLSSLFPEADKINNCYQSPMGAAIFSHFGGSPLSNGGISLKVQNTISANTTTTFTNCDKGIVSNQTSLTAKHLGMNNVLMGIMCGFTDNRSYTIQNNQLDNVFIGVQLYGQNLNSTIKYNTINCNLHPNGIVTASGMGAPLFWPKGIEIWNFNSIADDGMQVNLNTINIPHYAGVGISLANTGDQTSAQTNVIQLSNTNVTPIVCAGSTQLIGIGTVNSNNTGINDNSINANTYSQTAPEIRDDISGILLHKSQNNYLKCNMVSGSRFGLVAINNCGTNPLAIQGNIVYNSVLGWLMRHLGDEGTLGDVGDNANDNNNQFLGVTPAAKVFKFCENTVPGDEIFTGNINPLINESQSYNILSGVVNDCEYIIFPNPNAQLYSNSNCVNYVNETELDFSLDEALAIATDTKAYPEFPEMMHWYDSKRLYTYLDQNPSFKNSHNTLILFYNTMQSTAIAQEHAAEQKLRDLINNFVQNNPTIRELSLQAAEQENENIDASEQQDYNEREINRIYLKVIRHGIDSLSPEDKQFVTYLAPQCPYVEGSAVFKARALHAYYTPGVYYDDLKSCNTVGVYKTNNSSNTTTNLTLENEYLRKLMPNQFQSTIDTNNDDISIYPNPGTDIVTIKGMTFSGKIQLYDMIGRLVLEKDLRSPLSTIDISQLSNGVYNYSITKQGQKVYTGKIIKE